MSIPVPQTIQTESSTQNCILVVTPPSPTNCTSLDSNISSMSSPNSPTSNVNNNPLDDSHSAKPKRKSSRKTTKIARKSKNLKRKVNNLKTGQRKSKAPKSGSPKSSLLVKTTSETSSEEDYTDLLHVSHVLDDALEVRSNAQSCVRVSWGSECPSARCTRNSGLFRAATNSSSSSGESSDSCGHHSVALQERLDVGPALRGSNLPRMVILESLARDSESGETTPQDAAESASQTSDSLLVEKRKAGCSLMRQATRLEVSHTPFIREVPVVKISVLSLPCKSANILLPEVEKKLAEESESDEEEEEENSEQEKESPEQEKESPKPELEMLTPGAHLKSQLRKGGKAMKSAMKKAGRGMKRAFSFGKSGKKEE